MDGWMDTRVGRTDEQSIRLMIRLNHKHVRVARLRLDCDSRATCDYSLARDIESSSVRTRYEVAYEPSRKRHRPAVPRLVYRYRAYYNRSSY